MPTISVPQSTLDRPQTSGNTPQPQGLWQGVIEEVSMKSLPPFAGEPKSGFESSDGEILAIRIGNNQPMEGQESWGARKRFIDIVVRDGDTTIYEAPANEKGLPNWRLAQSAETLVKIAEALGAAERVDGNVTVSDAVLEALQNGDFNGTTIGYKVAHRPYTTAGGENRVEDRVVAFFPAA